MIHKHLHLETRHNHNVLPTTIECMVARERERERQGMDHKIDTLATLHNWTQGTPSLYPFTGIIQLCLAEEISVATAVEEISAFINGKGEGIGILLSYHIILHISYTP